MGLIYAGSGGINRAEPVNSGHPRLLAKLSEVPIPLPSDSGRWNERILKFWE
jgi:hypothetical protein